MTWSRCLCFLLISLTFFAGQSVLQTTSTTVRRHSTTSRRHAVRQSGRTPRYWIRLDHRRLTRGSSVRRGNMSSSRMYFSWDWQWLQITRQLEFKARPTTYCLTTSSYYGACRPPVCLFEEQASQQKRSSRFAEGAQSKDAGQENTGRIIIIINDHHHQHHQY